MTEEVIEIFGILKLANKFVVMKKLKPSKIPAEKSKPLLSDSDLDSDETEDDNEFCIYDEEVSNLSDGIAVEIVWDFGDGTTSTEASPTHTYTSEGIYTVTLTASGPGGSDLATCLDCITVGHPAPEASFTSSTTSGTWDLNVQFTSTSSGPVTDYLWGFGDGSSSTDASRRPPGAAASAPADPAFRRPCTLRRCPMPAPGRHGNGSVRALGAGHRPEPAEARSKQAAQPTMEPLRVR